MKPERNSGRSSAVRPDGALTGYRLEDAETVLVASNSIASTVRTVVDARREKGEKVGLLKVKLFRPFPRGTDPAMPGERTRVGVIDRNISPGSGGIFWLEMCGALFDTPGVILQDYLMGLGGGDVTPEAVENVVDDLLGRRESGEPCWKVKAYERMF